MTDEMNQNLAHDYTDAVFVGLGGCGINTISRLRKIGIKGSKTLCISRFEDELLVRGEDVLNFALLGKKDKPGYHRVPVSAEERAEAERRVREAVKGAKKVLLFAGLGGITGTAIAPIAAVAAKAEGATLGMVLTYPFKLERRRRELADNAYSALQGMADDFILRRNDDLAKMCPEKPMNEAFALFDAALAEEISAGGAKR